ncbi:MAG: hypothetical protein GF329_13820 [Candidatus Lokiarchaeota archaeon]|nr:hypothetical protein [Candidatus Lokiarchaeota archaeon]
MGKDTKENNENSEIKNKKSIFSFLKRWREYSEITNAGPIYRRFFVKNGFDGALTILGIIIGAWLANGGLYNIPSSLIFEVSEIKYIIFSGLGASLSMGVSGLWGKEQIRHDK